MGQQAKGVLCQSDTFGVSFFLSRLFNLSSSARSAREERRVT